MKLALCFKSLCKGVRASMKKVAQLAQSLLSLATNPWVPRNVKASVFSQGPRKKPRVPMEMTHTKLERKNKMKSGPLVHHIHKIGVQGW